MPEWTELPGNLSAVKKCRESGLNVLRYALTCTASVNTAVVRLMHYTIKINGSVVCQMLSGPRKNAVVSAKIIDITVLRT